MRKEAKTSAARNQHYVPQCYLKRFADDGSRIVAFDKATQQCFRTHVKNVASEKGFYDVLLEQVDGNHQLAESELAEYEGYADGAIKQFLAMIGNRNQFDTNSPGLKDALGGIIAFQFLRTREFRETLRKAVNELSCVSNQDRAKCLLGITVALLTHGSVIAQKKDKHLGSDPGAALSGNAPLEHAGVLFDGGYQFTRCGSEILKGHIWMVGDNQTNQPLYTSDSPVSLCPYDEEHSGGGLGLASTGVEVAFPLSSRYILVLTEPSYSAEEQIHDGRILLLTPEGVDRYNALQVWGSYRQVYCSQDRFDLAERTVGQSPALSRIDRRRFTIFNS